MNRLQIIMNIYIELSIHIISNLGIHDSNYCVNSCLIYWMLLLSLKIIIIQSHTYLSHAYLKLLIKMDEYIEIID